MCYVCGESDQAHPSDCSQQYEYDCNRQYSQGSSTILCLTRQTKVASGKSYKGPLCTNELLAINVSGIEGAYSI